MLMRVSVGMHKENIEAAIDTYHMMSERWFTHASPTLFNRCDWGQRCLYATNTDDL